MRVRFSHSHFSLRGIRRIFPFFTIYELSSRIWDLSIDLPVLWEKAGKGVLMKKRGVVQYTKAMSELHRYSSIKEAESIYSISHISGVCRRRRKSDGGYIWRYDDDADPYADSSNESST